MSQRAREVEAVGNAWRDSHNDTTAAHVAMVTLTVRHAGAHGRDLKRLLTGVSAAYRGLINGSPARRFDRKERIEGKIRRIETTHSHTNGWHVHVHALWFHRQYLDARLGLTMGPEAKERILERWKEQVRIHLGESYVPTDERGVDVLDVTSAHPGKYLTKMGIEVASIGDKTPKNGNRTPWMILRDATVRLATRPGWQREARAKSTENDRRLWTEWAHATKGHKLITISRGLRELAGLDIEDSEEVKDEPGSAVISVPRSAWGWVIEHDDGTETRGGLRRHPEAICTLLEAVEAGDAEHVLSQIVERFTRPDHTGAPERYERGPPLGAHI